LEASELFDDDLSSTVPDPDHSADENRYLIFGSSKGGKYLVVSFTDRRYSAITFCGRNIGAIAVEREDTHIQLTQLYIIPSVQKRGIGTYLIRQLIEEAKGSRKPLRLRVLATNPARRLYERQGFRVTAQTTERFFMELHVEA
jgi:ribosomal protein S18 acetylase RimI-like enzyme